MIYPTLTINPDQSIIINIYDTDLDNEPVLSMNNLADNSLDFFYTLLTLFLNQYIDGFNEGYEAGFDDAEYSDIEGGE